MTHSCPKCGRSIGQNVFGTICVDCKAYVAPIDKPKIVKDAERRLQEHQQQIRKFLREKLMYDMKAKSGESNGDQVK